MLIKMTKTEKTLWEKVGGSLKGEESFSLRDWEILVRESLCVFLIPGYTLGRAERNFGVPEKYRQDLHVIMMPEAFKAAIWGGVLYNAFQQYLN